MFQHGQRRHSPDWRPSAGYGHFDRASAFERAQSWMPVRQLCFQTTTSINALARLITAP
jgi:hypothetical protein